MCTPVYFWFVVSLNSQLWYQKECWEGSQKKSVMVTEGKERRKGGEGAGVRRTEGRREGEEAPVLMSLVRVWNSLFKAAIILINVVNEPLIAVMDLTLQLTTKHTHTGVHFKCMCMCNVWRGLGGQELKNLRVYFDFLRGKKNFLQFTISAFLFGNERSLSCQIEMLILLDGLKN